MKLSLCSEYALLSLIHIARQTNVEASTLEAIAAAQHIPTERLIELLAVLIRNRYLNNLQGRYQLARPAAEISVAEIIRLFDGVLAPMEPVSSQGYKAAPMEQEEKLVGLFSQIQAQATESLEGTSLAELT
jgi:Rrf2 family cysteine metabolism transcriptional repressor